MAIQRYKTKGGALRYKALVRDRGGNWMKSRSHGRKVDAEREERELLHAREAGTYRPERYAPLTFADAARQWTADVQRRGCSYRYRLRIGNSLNRHLLWYFSDMDIKVITPSDISRFINKSLEKGTKALTINSALRDLRTMLNFHVEEDNLRMTPFKKKHKAKVLEGSKERIVWTDEEAERFISYAERKHIGSTRWVYLAYKIALNTGLRYGEIIALTLEDFDFERSRIRVNKSYDMKLGELVTPKNGRVRYAPLPRNLAAVIRSFPIQSGRFFYNERKARYESYNSLHVNFLKDCKGAGVRRTRFHDMRGYFIRRYLMGGGNEAQLRKIVGHASRQMTDLYNTQIEDMAPLASIVEI